MQSYSVYSHSKLYNVGNFLNNGYQSRIPCLYIRSFSPESAINIYMRFFHINNPGCVQAYHEGILYSLNGECDGLIKTKQFYTVIFDSEKYKDVKYRFENKI